MQNLHAIRTWHEEHALKAAALSSVNREGTPLPVLKLHVDDVHSHFLWLFYMKATAVSSFAPMPPVCACIVSPAFLCYRLGELGPCLKQVCWMLYDYFNTCICICLLFVAVRSA